MNKLWSDRAWDEYLYWQQQDKKIIKKINELVKDIERNGLSTGIGHPEPLSTEKHGAEESTMQIDLYTTSIMEIYG